MLSQQEVIDEFNKIHNFKYDYSKFYFEDKQKPSIIICPHHGEFQQSYQSHSCGHGCPTCAMINKSKIANEKRISVEYQQRMKELFTERSKMYHGNKYDYSKFIYTNAKDKSIIICPHHGEFLQASRYHSIGHGCPKCMKKGNLNPKNRHL